MPQLSEKEFAALKLAALIVDVLDDDRTWTCSHCGAQTTVLCEICSGCGIEDVDQGPGTNGAKYR